MVVPNSYKRARPELDPLVDLARERLSSNQDLELLWQELRSDGCNLSASIAITMDATGMSHRDAKWAVCRSQTWSDFFPRVVELHDSIERALDEIAQEQKSQAASAE